MSMLEKHILPPSSPLGFELNGSIHVRPYNFFQGGGGAIPNTMMMMITENSKIGFGCRSTVIFLHSGAN